MDRSSKLKINNETQVLNDTLDEMDLIDIFRTFHPNAEYIFFSSVHGTFSRIDQSWVTNWTSVNLRKLKSYQASSYQNALRLDINYKKKTVRNTNSWRLNNMFLNNQQVTEEIKKGNQKISRNKWQRKHDNSKPMGCSKSSSRREVYSNTILPQETRENIE